MTIDSRALLAAVVLSASMPLAAQDLPSATADSTTAAPPADTTATASVPDPVDPARTGVKQTKGSGSRLIEEIVVTAAKREEKLQEVPISVQAFSADKLDAMGITSGHELPKITPGLTYTASAGYNIVYLRGVGSDAFLPAADQNIPSYLDGVALVQGEGSSDQLGRVSRIEVLKGPQGTLFGRNSTGGAISIITPDPDDEQFFGDVSVEGGNYSALNTLVFVNQPLAEGLAATLSGYSNSHDTYQQNQAGPTIDTYARGGRLKLRWEASDDVSFNVSGLYGETSNNAAMAKENIRVSAYFKPLVPEDPKADYRFSENVVSGIVQYNYLFAGGADVALPWADIKLIGSDQKVFATYANYDYDGSVSPLVSFRPVDQYGEQKTLELQLISNSEAPFAGLFSFVAGVYYLEGDGGFPTLELNVAANSGLLGPGPVFDQLQGLRNNLINLAGPAFATLGNEPITAVSGGILTSKSLSGYFQGTVHMQEMLDLEDRVNLVLGLRVQEETRGLKDNRLGALSPVNGEEITFLRFSVPDISEVQLPFKVALQWFPSETMQIYGGMSRGFTAPTYNTVNFFSAPDKLKAQRTDSYELGVKTQLLDQTLTFNAATFFIDQKELLTAFASVTSGGVVRFDNAKSARIYGFEFDAAWQVMPDLNPGLALIGSFSYLKTEYTDYKNARGYDSVTGISFGQGAPLPARDVTGNEIVRTPPISYNVGINQSIELANSDRIELAVDTNYSDKFFFDPANQKEFANPAFQIFDARTTYFYDRLGLELTAFVRNLTKEKYFSSVFLLDPGQNVTLNNPRTYGLRLKYTF